jgi:hypothetical protein
MPSKTETSALRPMRALCDATDGRPMQWRSLEGLDVPETNDAVRYAVTRGGGRAQRLPNR